MTMSEPSCLSDLIGKKITSIEPLGGPMIHTHLRVSLSGGVSFIIPAGRAVNQAGMPLQEDFSKMKRRPRRER
jgi:hypothetical protein